MSGQRLSHGDIAEMAEEYEEGVKPKPTKFIMVVYGYIYSAPAHMVMAQSYERKFGEKHTQRDVEDTIIETEAFIRNVLED